MITQVFSLDPNTLDAPLFGPHGRGLLSGPPDEVRRSHEPPTVRPSVWGLLRVLPSVGRRFHDPPPVTPLGRRLLGILPSEGRRLSAPSTPRLIGKWLLLHSCLPYKVRRSHEPPLPGCYHPRFSLDALFPSAPLLLLFSNSWKDPFYSQFPFPFL